MTATPTTPTTPEFLVAATPGRDEFERLRRRARAGIWIETLGVLALLLVAFALPSLLVDRMLRLEWIVRAVLLATFVVVVVRAIRRRLWQPLTVQLSDEEMALAVERRAPDVKQALISSLQFDRELQSGTPGVESPAMKAAVVADVRARLAAIPFAAAIDRARVRRYGLDIAGAVVFFVGWAVLDAGSLGLWAARNLALANVDWPRYTTLHLPTGASSTLRLPQGDTLTVRVEVTGPVPDQVFVEYAFATGERGSESTSRTGEREFTWTIESVLADMQLELQGGDALPLTIAVQVVERPRVDDLAVRVTYPSYMEREPEVVPPTQGELRLPKGATLSFAGKSQKALAEAFVLFGDEHRTALALAPDARSFAGDFAPTASGLLVVDVVDQDRLGAGTPPKLVLRVGDDKPPTLEFRLRGIGASITTHARIPGTLKVTDDFGLREVTAAMRAILDAPPEKGVPPPPETPFQPATAMFAQQHARSALRYETGASVDLMQWNTQPREDDAGNPIRIGMLFSLRFAAKDNFGPGEPHEGVGETMSFRVVSREKLGEELRRRQVEQRAELQRIADEEQKLLFELTETPNPKDLGDRRREAETRFKTLVRQQKALGGRTALVGEAYQRILWESENNRLADAPQVRQWEQQIPVPLQQLAKESFPGSSRLIDAFAASTDEAARAAAVESCKDIHRRLLTILKSMQEAEDLAALIEDLKKVILLEKEAIDEVQGRMRERETDIFGEKPGPKKK